MIRRSWLAALILCLVPVAVFAADSPPRDLHVVGDHWTAWNPPASFPAGAETYIIVRGDTLWGLAARFYGDPYLWPQLWESNRYILDAHWIYPGDPLLVGMEVTPVEDLSGLDLTADLAAGTEGEGETDDQGTALLTAEGAAGAPVPLGTESDLYCSGFIGELDEGFPYSIIGSEYEALSIRLGRQERALSGSYGIVDTTRYGMADGDIIYVDGGRQGGLEPGMLLMAVERGEKVLHPVDDRVLGRLYHYLSRVRILSVQEETAIGEIVRSCDAVVVGALLKPFEPEPVPLGRLGVMRPPNMPSPAAALEGAPMIVEAQDNLVTLGQDHIVYIDRGLADDVAPGDVYTIYRMHRRELPPVVVGELAVLSAQPHSAMAKIIANRHTVYVGDRLERK